MAAKRISTLVEGAQGGFFFFSSPAELVKIEQLAGSLLVFHRYSSLLAWPPTRLSASMDLAPLFLAFRFSRWAGEKGSAPRQPRIVCQPKWLPLYQSPGIVCHCWRRQRKWKPCLLGFFREFTDACEVNTRKYLRISR